MPRKSPKGFSGDYIKLEDCKGPDAKLLRNFRNASDALDQLFRTECNDRRKEKAKILLNDKMLPIVKNCWKFFPPSDQEKYQKIYRTYAKSYKEWCKNLINKPSARARSPSPARARSPSPARDRSPSPARARARSPSPAWARGRGRCPPQPTAREISIGPWNMEEVPGDGDCFFSFYHRNI